MNQPEASSHSHLLTEAERQKLLVEWNATDMELPKASSIHELIERRAVESPEALALICRDDRVTYSELNARADQLASHLRKLGVGPETLVGICVERSLEMVIGLLGILKSGGAYVPLDPTYPKERLALMLEDARPLVLVTQSTLLDLLPKTRSHILCIDTINRAIESHRPQQFSDQSQVTDHQSPITQHALRITHYASRITHHASRITHHAS